MYRCEVQENLQKVLQKVLIYHIECDILRVVEKHFKNYAGGERKNGYVKKFNKTKKVRTADTIRT